MVALLIRGVNGGDQFSNTLFQVPNLSAEAAAGAKQYLRMTQGETPELVYVSERRDGKESH